MHNTNEHAQIGSQSQDTDKTKWKRKRNNVMGYFLSNMLDIHVDLATDSF